MRRGWTVLPVVTMFVLAACQGGGDDASPGADGGGGGEGIAIDETAVSGAVRSVRLAIVGFGGGAARETIEAFSEKYPNIKVNYEPIPEGYIDQMTAQFSAGEPPDVFYVGGVLRRRGWRTGCSSRSTRTSRATRVHLDPFYRPAAVRLPARRPDLRPAEGRGRRWRCSTTPTC